MPLVVYTGQLPRRDVPGYLGPDAMDITRSSKGIGRSFAPSRGFHLEAERRRRLAGTDRVELEAWFDWFAPRYIRDMEEQMKRNRAPWEAILSGDVVTLCCYCGHRGLRCHRVVLGRILERLGAVYRGERR